MHNGLLKVLKAPLKCLRTAKLISYSVCFVCGIAVTRSNQDMASVQRHQGQETTDGEQKTNRTGLVVCSPAPMCVVLRLSIVVGPLWVRTGRHSTHKSCLFREICEGNLISAFSSISGWKVCSAQVCVCALSLYCRYNVFNMLVFVLPGLCALV